MAETPTREEVIKGLRDLQNDTRTITYDTYMGGFKILNPRFAELEAIIESKGGSFANGTKDLFEKAFNESPELMETFIKISQDPAKMDQFIEMMKTDQGSRLISSVMSYNMGMSSGLSVDGITTPTEAQFKALQDLGFSEVAEKDGLEIKENPIKTPGDALALLGTLFLPAGGAASLGLRGVFTGGARIVGGQIAKRPFSSLMLADLATGGAGSEAAIKWSAKSILGEDTYNALAGLFRDAGDPPKIDPTKADPAKTDPTKADLTGDNIDWANMAGPAALLAAGAFVLYNLFSGNIGMALTIAASAIGLKVAYDHFAKPTTAAPAPAPV
jgi:hypothetical protein